MNLDDLMAVWKTQDSGPLHGVDKTLLHLALRQEQAKLQKQRHWERAFIYITSAFLFGLAGLFLAVMIYSSDEGVLVVWDYIIAVIGVAGALVTAGGMFATQRLQSARDRDFGDSLRDQLRHRIAQLDDAATKERRLTQIMVVATLICGLAVYVAVRRINEMPYDQDWPVALGLIFLAAVVLAARRRRRAVQQDILPRKQRLEALLNELDGQ